VRDQLKPLSTTGAIGAIGVAAMGLLGYLPGLGALGRIRESYIPMAPSTAMGLILLGSAQLVLSSGSRSRARHAIPLVFAFLVFLFGMLEVVGHFSGMDLNFESTLVPATGDLDGVPIARMSPATGALFTLSGLSILILAVWQRRQQKSAVTEYLGSAFATLVLLVSFTFCTAYLYGTPLLYGLGTTIPMALTTAVGFMVLAISVLASARVSPLRLLVGGSTRSYVLRFVLPLSVLSVMVGGVAVSCVEPLARVNPALIASAATVLVVLFAGLVATLVARHMGGQIDSSRQAAREAEATLSAISEEYKLTLDDLLVGVVVHGSDTNIMMANPEASRVLGLTHEQLMGKGTIDPAWNFVKEDLTIMAVEDYPVSRVMSLGKPIHDMLLGVQRPDRDYVTWAIANAIPVSGKDGELDRVIVNFVDITDRKGAENELLSSKEHLRTTLHSIGDAVIVTDMAGMVTQMNPVAEQLTGWSLEDSEGRALSDIFAIVNAYTRERVDNPVDNVLANGEIVGLANHTVLIAKDGEERQIADSAAPIIDVGGDVSGVVLVFRDVTEKYRKDEELFRARKLESVGLLAGGIAHDFNNILAGLFGNIELAQLRIPRDHDAYPYMETASHSLERATSLTQQLLTFSKGGDPILEAVDVAEVVRESVAFNLSGSTVDAVLDLPDDLWQIEADRGQLSQVMANLAINAKQAMPEGGHLHVRAENAREGEDGAGSVLSGDCVRISLRDEGTGIAEEHVAEVFDPYFSTKQSGSGLGLATVHSIVSKHGGHISLDSKLGIGTTFTVYFPAAVVLHGAGGASPGESSRSEVLPGHVLVMDDEEAIRDLSIKRLRICGCSGEPAVDGDDAIEKYVAARKAGNPFDIVIMDLTIPGGTGGREAIHRLLAIDPDAKVIVSSGYSTDPIMAHYRDYGFRGRLVKPSLMTELRGELSRVMNEG
jgi:PAS domain S-box-containing protein